jgi:hypothetical protein
MAALLTHPTFALHLNTKFRVLREGLDPVEIELTEVGDFLQSQHQERFAIVFRGPVESFLQQSTYTFDHDQMGRFDLFIVPIRQSVNGYDYEAVFNRLRQ